MLVGIPVYEDVNVSMLPVLRDVQLDRYRRRTRRREAGPVKFVAADGRGFQGLQGRWKLRRALVPGGEPNALARLMGDPKRTYLDFLIEQSAGAQFVTSVCEGALLLAAAGLLDGYEATTHWAFIPCLTERFQT